MEGKAGSTRKRVRKEKSDTERGSEQRAVAVGWKGASGLQIMSEEESARSNEGEVCVLARR